MLPRSLLQANHDRTADQTKVSGAPCPLLLFLVYTCGMESAAQFAALAHRDLPFWVRPPVPAPRKRYAGPAPSSASPSKALCWACALQCQPLESAMLGLRPPVPAPRKRYAGPAPSSASPLKALCCARARACERSGAGSVAGSVSVIFPSERRAPFWRFCAARSISSAPLAQHKMPFGNLLGQESVE